MSFLDKIRRRPTSQELGIPSHFYVIGNGEQKDVPLEVGKPHTLLQGEVSKATILPIDKTSATITISDGNHTVAHLWRATEQGYMDCTVRNFSQGNREFLVPGLKLNSDANRLEAPGATVVFMQPGSSK